MAAWFDENYYLKTKLAQLDHVGEKDASGKAYTLDTLKQAIAAAGMTPESHYLSCGRQEKLNPNPYFNESEYLQAKLAQLHSVDARDASGKVYTLEALVQAIDSIGMNAAEHYETYGSKETTQDGHLLNPSNAFDSNAYVAAKLVELQKGPDAAIWKDKTPADVVKAIADAGMSPVTHYESYGAQEAGNAGVALVQTVPSEQRVPNDPARATVTGEIVPTNYNPPSLAPDKAVAAPVAKPADVGSLAPETVSPPVTVPAHPALVPGDPGYVAPPAGLVDTPGKPVIPPTSTGTGNATDNWITVNSDGSGTVTKPDGTPGGTLPPGTIDTTPDDGGDIVIPPDVKPAPIDPPVNPGGGGGGGGTPPQTTSDFTASYDSSTHVLTLGRVDEPTRYSPLKVVMNADSTADISVTVHDWNTNTDTVYRLANPVTGPCAGITTINASAIKASQYAEVDIRALPSVTKVQGAGKVFVSKLDSNTEVIGGNYTSVIVDDPSDRITLADADFTKLSMIDDIKLHDTATVTLGTEAQQAGISRIFASETGETALAVANGFSSDLYFSAGSGKTTFDASASTARTNIQVNDGVTSGSSLTGGAGGKDNLIIAVNEDFNWDDSGIAPNENAVIDLTNIHISGIENINLWAPYNGSSTYLPSATLTLGADIDSTSVHIDFLATYVKSQTVDASAVRSSTSLTIAGKEGNDVFTAGQGNDILDGGAGANTLTGGDGTDTFRIGDTLSAVQTITDFDPANETIELNANLFGVMKIGAITDSQFLSAAGAVAATTADQRFIYNTTTGNLYFDADGNGTNSVTAHIATLSNKPTLTTADIVIKSGFTPRHLEGSSGNDLLIGEERASLDGCGGNDIFQFAPSGFTMGEYDLYPAHVRDFSTGDKLTFTGVTLTKATGGTFTRPVTDTGSNNTSAEVTISIDENGVATKNDSPDNAFYITEVEKALTQGEGETLTAGTCVVFSVGNSTSLFVSNGTAGLNDGDMLIDLGYVGVQTVGGFTISADGTSITGFTA